jgi:hypothetical protein
MRTSRHVATYSKEKRKKQNMCEIHKVDNITRRGRRKYVNIMGEEKLLELASHFKSRGLVWEGKRNWRKRIVRFVQALILHYLIGQDKEINFIEYSHT